MGNAVKFTEEGGVTVSLGLEGDAATVAVRDTGPGILAEDKESIFTEFGLGHCARVRDTEGTGLGQPIALRLANLLGGSIALTSAVGEDSVFTLVIPLELHDASALPNRINLSTDAWPEPSGRSLPLALGAMSVRELFPVGYM